MNSIQKQIQASSFNAVSLIRKLYPALVAQHIVGVQPMTYNMTHFNSRTIRMPKPKYNFSRAKWYEAEFNEKDYGAVRSWCAEQFGPLPKNPDAWSRWRWRDHSWTTVRFRDERDYTWFVLRWSA